MGERPSKRFRPAIERLERKQVPGSMLSAGLVAGLRAARAPFRQQQAGPPRRPVGPDAGRAGRDPMPAPAIPTTAQPAPVRGVVLSRITNPKNPASVALRPPFLKQVQVQSNDPIPGRRYNVIFVSVFNGTGRTFTADDQLAVKLTGQAPGHAYPILTGDERWQPGQHIILYALTTQSYTDALSPPESAGFSLNLPGPPVVAIPGPSGFFQRVVYKPETFPHVLDSIVAFGPGSRGRRLGLPDTALWQVVPISEADIL